MYYSYHATAHRLIDTGKLIGYYYTDKHNTISPALVLVFDDFKHPLMPIDSTGGASMLRYWMRKKKCRPVKGGKGHPLQ